MIKLTMWRIPIMASFNTASLSAVYLQQKYASYFYLYTINKTDSLTYEINE